MDYGSEHAAASPRTQCVCLSPVCYFAHVVDAGQFRILNPIGGHLGLPYAFAYFITDGMGAAQALGIYPQSFRSSIFLQKPLDTVCVWALAADTDEEA